MSLRGRKQQCCGLERKLVRYNAAILYILPFTNSHAAVERVGKSNIGQSFVEGCIGCGSQCEYLSHFFFDILREPDAFCLQFMVPPLTVYLVICERLETIGHIMDASECFRQMMHKLEGQSDARAKGEEWIVSELSSICVEVILCATSLC